MISDSSQINRPEKSIRCARPSNYLWIAVVGATCVLASASLADGSETSLRAETGTNDIRISDMGTDTITDFNTFQVRAAFNPLRDEYLVVWAGDDDTPPLVDGENEIRGQRIDATTGAELGTNDFRISFMGNNAEVDPTIRDNFFGIDPHVAYNSMNDEYLVVWAGDDDTPPTVDGENEIYGQRLDGETGASIGGNFRISDMGGNGDNGANAQNVAIAYNSTDNEYLVVWAGDDATAPLATGEFEIFGQRLDAATGAEIGTNDFRISDMGNEAETDPDTRNDFGAFNPRVAYNSTDNEYLVVWQADDDTGALVDNESEIWGQRLDADTGVEVGTNDFRISDLGAVDGSSDFDASEPDVAYNGIDNEYLVVWRGDDNTPPLVDGEQEVFGQRINAATGAEVGTNDFRISDMGDDGELNSEFRDNFLVSEPRVEFNAALREYLVVWGGEDDTPPLVDGEFEAYAQRIEAATGAEVGDNDVRVSDMGNDAESDPTVRDDYRAGRVDVVAGSGGNYLIVWEGDDDSTNESDNTLVENENEAFIQLFEVAGLPCIPGPIHAADQNMDNAINLSELLRVIQFFNSNGLACANPPESTEDGYEPGPGLDQSCCPHSSDYNPQDWEVSLSELLRAIQFFNSGGYSYCPLDGTEDAYCPGAP